MDTRLFLPLGNRVADIWGFPVYHACSLWPAGNMSDKHNPYPGQAAESRGRFLDEAGFGGYKKVRMIPRHGTDIIYTDSRDSSKEILCDGLITTDPHVALTVCVGDCYPIIISTRAFDFLMLLHVGVRGAAEGIIRKALQLVKGKYLIPRERLLVGMGPGICARCYDAQWIGEQYGNREEWKSFFPLDECDGKQHCDLRGYIRHEFLHFGVKEKNLFVARECTCCSRYPDGRFFLASHHRAKTHGNEERFLVAAAMARQPQSLKRFFGYSVSAVQPQ